ncbi:MAG: sel1 repeat family protein [Treponema sp.]|nr:sel1 repeat family protein [Treponema sp.]
MKKIFILMLATLCSTAIIAEGITEIKPKKPAKVYSPYNLEDYYQPEDNITFKLSISDEDIKNGFKSKHDFDLNLDGIKNDSKNSASESTKKNETEIDIEVLKKLAETGHSQSQFFLGRCYARGEGIEQNWTEARKWYELSAKNGDYKAQNNLAVIYLDGHGVDVDYKQARYWFEKALEKNKTYPNIGIGMIYIKESGDYKTAVKHFKEAEKAGGQEIIAAYANLALVYSDEKSGICDYKKAVSYYKKAANLNDDFSQYVLGTFYLEGKGVKKNEKEGIEWLNLAKSNGSEEAAELLEKINSKE